MNKRVMGKSSPKPHTPEIKFRKHEGSWDCWNEQKGWLPVHDLALRGVLESGLLGQTHTFPFRLHDGNYQKFDHRTLRWAPMAPGSLQVWHTDGKKHSMPTRKVLWILSYGSIPLGMSVDYINHLPEDRPDNLYLMKRGTCVREKHKATLDKRVKLLTHRKELLLLLPSTADFGFFAERWNCHKNTLLNFRSKNKHIIQTM